jgi:hypothetical protein
MHNALRAHDCAARHWMVVVMADLVDNGYFGQRPGVWGKYEAGPDIG